MIALREDMPSSGNVTHVHDWQKLEESNGKITLVCRVGSCGATKVVDKPKVQESQGQKPLLFG